MRPNVLLLCTDQQRFDALGASGNDEIETPNLDRLAAQGALFENCYVQNPVCGPSRASLMTGRYVHQHGLWANGVGLPDHERLFSKDLADAGYDCGLVGKFHLDACFGGRSEKRHDDGFRVFRWAHDPYPGSSENAYHRWLHTLRPDLAGDGRTVDVRHAARRDPLQPLDRRADDRLPHPLPRPRQAVPVHRQLLRPAPRLRRPGGLRTPLPGQGTQPPTPRRPDRQAAASRPRPPTSLRRPRARLHVVQPGRAARGRGGVLRDGDARRRRGRPDPRRARCRRAAATTRSSSSPATTARCSATTADAQGPDDVRAAPSACR